MVYSKLPYLVVCGSFIYLLVKLSLGRFLFYNVYVIPQLISLFVSTLEKCVHPLFNFNFLLRP